MTGCSPRALHWGLALVPVLVLLGHLRLARRVQADEPAAKSWSCCCSAGLRRARRLSDQRAPARHAADRLHQSTAATSRRGSRKRSRRSIMIAPLPLQPHRLQARRGHLRLRHRRRLLGRREHHLSDPLPRLRRRHLAGARPRHRGHARHDARACSPPSRTNSPNARRANRPPRFDFHLLWFVPGYLRCGRDRTPPSTSSPTGR